MDPAGDEHLDFGEEEYGGSQKMPYHAGGAISALVDEDDECDDLYNDVNVGEGFMQIQQSRAPLPPVDVGNGGIQGNVPGSRGETATAHRVNIPSVAGGNYPILGIRFQDQKNGLTPDIGSTPSVDASQKGRTEMAHSLQGGHMGYQGPIPTPQNVGLALYETSERVAIQPIKALNSGGVSSRVNPQMPTNQISVGGNVNIIQPLTMENQMRPAIDNGNTMVFIGELHWWTTDAELETVLTQYGRVKEIKFYDERASGKSKGYCQVEFFDSSAAAACKEHMNGHPFNGRACVVALASPQTIKQVAASYASKNPVQPQAQPQGRRPMNDGSGRGNGTIFPNGDAGRGYGRGWGGRGGQGMPNKGPGTGPGRGRGAIGAKMMNPQGMMGPGFDPTFMGRGMMGPGFDPTFMGRGAGYGGFPAPAFHPGMMPPFQAVNHMGLPGVAPHVNPAFFGRGMTANGMNMMGPTGMDGPHAGMWPADTNMAQRGGDRTRESSYGGEDDASEYEYGEASQDKGARSNAASRGSERDYERKHRDVREHDRDHRYREEKDSHRDYRHKERDPGHEDDRERGQSSKSRSRSRAVPEEDHRSRSRDADYGKRRRLPSE